MFQFHHSYDQSLNSLWLKVKKGLLIRRLGYYDNRDPNHVAIVFVSLHDDRINEKLTLYAKLVYDDNLVVCSELEYTGRSWALDYDQKEFFLNYILRTKDKGIPHKLPEYALISARSFLGIPSGLFLSSVLYFVLYSVLKTLLFALPTLSLLCMICYIFITKTSGDAFNGEQLAVDSTDTKKQVSDKMFQFHHSYNHSLKSLWLKVKKGLLIRRLGYYDNRDPNHIAIVFVPHISLKPYAMKLVS
uniref:Uncharacterized protein n=1 Tax=Amphimedon queenslandica TaxID=400682 RepID=A0A1X7VXC5_AMPQE